MKVSQTKPVRRFLPSRPRDFEELEHILWAETEAIPRSQQGKFQAQTEGFVCACCGDGIGEVIKIGIALMGKVEQCMRVLMHEKRIFTTDIPERAKPHARSGKAVPGFRWNRMCRIPSDREKPGGWPPAHREGRATI
jgi:hypothetical protein